MEAKVVLLTVGVIFYLNQVFAIPECGHKGLCPYIGRQIPFGFDFVPKEDRPSLCGNLCYSDDHCKLFEKCCPTTCGFICHRAIYLED